MCRLTLSAGITPQLFEAEVRCHVRPDEEAAFRHVARAVAEGEDGGGEAFADVTDSGSVVEEVIELSPDRRTRADAVR